MEESLMFMVYAVEKQEMVSQTKTKEQIDVQGCSLTYTGAQVCACNLIHIHSAYTQLYKKEYHKCKAM